MEAGVVAALNNTGTHCPDFARKKPIFPGMFRYKAANLVYCSFFIFVG